MGVRGRSLVAALLLLLLPAAASGHGGLVLMASGTATVDAVINPDEWGTATPIHYPASLPDVDGGGSVPATLWVMNDESNLYLAVRVFARGSDVSAVFAFDRDHDLVHENRDDHLSVLATTRTREASFSDQHHSGCRLGTCTVVLDSASGGTTDGRAAAITTAESTSIEVVHPLDSADNAHDFSLAPGAVVGFSHFVTLLTGSPCISGCSARSATVRGEIALSPPAQLSVRHVRPPRRTTVGATVTYTLVVANNGGGTSFDVRLSDTLPRGARALGATATQGTCTRSRAVAACRLGAIRPFRSATVRIRARLTRAGRAENSARVLSLSHEEITADNLSRAATTVVRR